MPIRMRANSHGDYDYTLTPVDLISEEVVKESLSGATFESYSTIGRNGRTIYLNKRRRAPISGI